jgi:hypothetical protein
MPEIRLEKPGKLVGSAKNAKDYTFFIVLDKPQFSREALEASSASFSGPDLLFKSEPVPDEDGMARLNLGDHVNEINRRLKDDTTPVRFAVLAKGKGAGSALAAAAVEAGSLVMMKPTVEVKTVTGATKLEFGSPLAVAVEFRNADSVKLTVEPDGALRLSETSLTTPSATIEAAALKAGSATIVASAMWGSEARAVGKLQFDVPAVDPKVELDKAKLDLGADASIVLSGTPLEDYTLVFTPQSGGQAIEKKSPFGKMREAGRVGGTVKLEGGQGFRGGKYDVTIRTGGKESPKVELEVVAPYPKGTYELTCNRLGAAPLEPASKGRFTITGDDPTAITGTIDFSAYGYPNADPLSGVQWDGASRTLSFLRGSGVDQQFTLTFEDDANVYSGKFTFQGGTFDCDGLKVF